jgi:hypothetical protein
MADQKDGKSPSAGEVKGITVKVKLKMGRSQKRKTSGRKSSRR